jgi:CRISPR system Cascade subunit CasC
MFIELHIIQNFAPSCLNRDETNAPKDCIFGGVRRARISSQCIKRAIRSHAQASPKLKGHLAIRTKRLLDKMVDLLKNIDKPQEEKPIVAKSAIQTMGLNIGKDGMTEYLIFLGESEILELKELIMNHWDTLLKMPQTDSSKDDGDKKKAKKEKKESIPPEVKKAFEQVLEKGKAADLALFGRMLADLPSKNVDAACQVAHAISTHKVDMEMDFFTAIDDLNPKDESGAGMMGTVEYNSACFYRYAVINWEKLLGNIKDKDLARFTVEAFLHASIEAIPTGKQNTFAAQNPPSFIFAVVREKGMPWSLANAFEKPVWTNGKGWIEESIKRLDEYWGKLSKMYGDNAEKHWISEFEGELPNLGECDLSIDKMVEAILQKLK